MYEGRRPEGVKGGGVERERKRVTGGRCSVFI